MTPTPRWWLVRCEGGDLFDDFVEGGFIALGGEETQPDLSGATDSQSLRQILEASGIWQNAHSMGYTNQP